jgi:cleavage stimulation factor subunit 3
MSLSHSNFPRVEELFTRCLRTTPSVELWRLYLSYTRRVNPLPPAGGSGSEDGESERDKVRKIIEGAYEFALRFVGQSRDSGEVWREYLVLLKEREVRLPRRLSVLREG